MTKNELESLISEGLTKSQIMKRTSLSQWKLDKYLKIYDLTVTTVRKLDEEQKKKISEARKKFLKENPDKHPWRNKDKFKSIPCERAKEYLRNENINFIEEYPCNIPGRFFSIDIAMPDKMIAIEINGNQHYERDGTLKPYYQERHNLLVDNGWQVFEIHYSHCFSLDKWAEFLSLIKDSQCLVIFDYFNYTPAIKEKRRKDVPKAKRVKKEKILKPKKEKKQKPPKVPRKNSRPDLKKCPNCGNNKNKTAKTCMNCFQERNKKIKWPSVEEMAKLVFEKPATELSKDLGVSDVAITKFCKKHNIEKPGLGYWMKNPLQKKI